MVPWASRSQTARKVSISFRCGMADLREESWFVRGLTGGAYSRGSLHARPDRVVEIAAAPRTPKCSVRRYVSPPPRPYPDLKSAVPPLSRSSSALNAPRSLSLAGLQIVAPFLKSLPDALPLLAVTLVNLLDLRSLLICERSQLGRLFLVERLESFRLALLHECFALRLERLELGLELLPKGLELRLEGIHLRLVLFPKRSDLPVDRLDLRLS